MPIRLLAILLATAALCACASTSSPEPAGGGTSAFDAELSSRESVTLAIADTRRLEGDALRDAQRKPADVLQFFGIGPGMVVLDMYAGGGYYTELAAYAVGECGTVWSHNNEPYIAYAGDELARRFAAGRLANVRRITAENNQLSLPAGTFDAVLMVLAYHDIYYVDDASGWVKIDGPAMLAELYQSMKPGAVLGVVDHSAREGAPADAGQSLHRIDPARLKREISEAGFVFEAASDALRNAADDLALPAFDPAIRGNTDRFVYRFRRP